MKFRYNMSFTLPYNPRDVDPSYKVGLDFWDCFWKENTQPHNRRNTVIVLKIVSWGGKLLVLCSQFCFTAMQQRSQKTQSATIKPTIYLPKVQFQYSYPHSNARLYISSFKVYYIALKANTFCNVKSDIGP